VLFQRDAHFVVTADIHYPAEYFLTVGDSAIARKGTTTNAVLEIMERVSGGFKDRILHGLSSGQGLISALMKKQPEDSEESDAIPEPIAPAVLVEISEFAELLAVMKREENTLSAVMRDAWDGKPLAVLTRNKPLKVKNVSLATLAHITRKELLSKLTSTDRANGFANRFLFLWTERAKLLPRGDLSRLDLDDVVASLRKAVQTAKNTGEVRRDEETELLWAEAYKRLTTRGDTMTDTLLSRADAHVVRLSLLYALLDSSTVIRKEHLQAALAVWDYCEESVRFVFGDVADPDTAKILRKLEDGPLTEGEIRRMVFGDHKPSEWVAEKMIELEQLRKVRRDTKQFKTKVVAAWYLVECEP
jgi:DNA-binding HxlR family transcriptional regulator